jgi:hypothetical protein
MKTGRDADYSGLYVSECCQKKRHILKGQMLPRCPRCFSLTAWEILEHEAADRNEEEPARIS